MTRTIRAIDLFCGAGGTSTGLIEVCEELGFSVDLLAINHWDVAIATHSNNHPNVKHLCTGVDTVNPRDLVREGKIKQKIHLLVASPECQHHSNARGGRPMSDQKRATAWHILWWLEALDVQNVLIENVKEFRDWGPLDSRGRPLKRKKGELYIQFLKSLEALGYKVQARVLNAAHYGAATSRERLFIQARKGRRQIKWSEPTHGAKATRTLFGPVEKFRPAREVIDWNLPGKSIYFDRKKPLAPNTMARIFAGLQKFSGLPFVLSTDHTGGNGAYVKNLEEPLGTITSKARFGLCQPFIVIYKGKSKVRGIDEPLPTMTSKNNLYLCEPELKPFLVGAGGPEFAGGPRSVDEPLRTVLTRNHQALIQPFIVVLRTHSDARSIEEPLPTVCAQGNHIGVCQPYLIKYYKGSDACSIDEPLPTVTANYEHLGLCQPFLIPFFGERNGQQPRAHSIEEPLPTVTGQGAGGLVQPFIMQLTHGHDDWPGRRCHSIDEPMKTITSMDDFALVEPFLISYHGNHNGRADGNNRAHSLQEPLRTVDGSNRIGLVQPFIFKYNSTGGARSVDEPLDTITTKDRFGLVTGIELGEGDELAILDIRFRMLQWYELAEAMSFPKTYSFAGNKDQKVKQIGNAVDVRQAKALCRPILEDYL